MFALESNELGCTSAIEHKIRIENDEAFKERFWRIPPPLLEEVCASLRDMLEAGAICPSQSPWCNTVVLVRKKDRTLHFCVDFRCLNVRMKKDSYPLPQIQEALERMAGSAHFSSMDFKSGFLADQDGPGITAVHSLHHGEPQVLRVYTHALWAVQRTGDVLASHAEHLRGVEPHVLHNLLGRRDSLGCIEEEHLERLRVVFERFCEFNLKLNPSKCSFFQSEIMYLAHHVSQRGILPSRENVRAVQEFPMPETYTQVHAFCGLAGHYRRFIKGFANIARSLYDVLEKEVKMGPVDLPPEAQEAMAVLKGKVQSTPVLVFPDFKKPFLLETDASKEGLGAVLSQKQSDRWYHPVGFGSHSLTPAEKNYHSSKLEFLALKWSVMEHFKEQQPTHLRVDNAKSRRYGAPMVRRTGFISV